MEIVLHPPQLLKQHHHTGFQHVYATSKALPRDMWTPQPLFYQNFDPIDCKIHRQRDTSLSNQLLLALLMILPKLAS